MTRQSGACGAGRFEFKFLAIGFDSYRYLRITPDGKISELGKPPKRHAGAAFSDDGKKVFVTVRNYRGDAWMMRVSRK